MGEEQTVSKTLEETHYITSLGAPIYQLLVLVCGRGEGSLTASHSYVCSHGHSEGHILSFPIAIYYLQLTQLGTRLG